MSNRIQVKPRDGLKVPGQNGQFMRHEVQSVPNTAYYLRLIQDGDLQRVQNTVQQQPTAIEPVKVRRKKGGTDGR